MVTGGSHARRDASGLRSLNNLCQAGYYYHQIERLAAGQTPTPELGTLRALLSHMGKDYFLGFRRKLAGH